MRRLEDNYEAFKFPFYPGLPMRITIFDTETTGLPKRGAGLSEQPHVIQFASQTFEFDPVTRRFVEVERCSQLIKPPVPVPEEITRLCGITDQQVTNSPAFAEFADRIVDIFARSDLAVAHNLSFDREILEYEFSRIGRSRDFLPANTYDSLEGTRNLCKLPGKNGNYKAPRLMELHQFLLNESFQEAHNAEKDVEALSRCVKVLLQQGLYQPVLQQKQESSSEQTALF